MSYYVLGFDEQGRALMLTRRVFASLDDAAAYRDSCHPSWRPHIVQTL